MESEARRFGQRDWWWGGEHWCCGVQAIISLSTAAVTADGGFLCARAAVHGTR